MTDSPNHPETRGSDDPASADARGEQTAAVNRARDALREISANPTAIPEAIAGAMIGSRYKLLEPIGEGGMGIVWMAEQRSPVKRLVAIKLIKAGMDSRAVLTRFEAERQALAMMDHPNIARVFDGGTTDLGHPYFVMELVKGLPLTVYCDERHLNVRQRLELFATVCAAVQHAHQKGVIHRDLKPGNLLVTEHDGKPVPKVIDFGLAKALGGSSVLTDHTLHTAFGAVAGTPMYMAPEQVAINALDIDTRTDIYALGVILYELLTGTTPHNHERLKRAAWEEVRRVIREEEPQRPSLRISQSGSLVSLAASRNIEPARLGRLVAGEVDWIVMKALDKDRHRRYGSASDLAADVQRHLSGEPIVAAPPSVTYRARKFMRKHRALISVAATISVLLIGGVIGTTLGFTRERAARVTATTAEREAIAARTVSEIQNDQLRRQSRRVALMAAQQAIATGEMRTAKRIIEEIPNWTGWWECRYLHNQVAGSTEQMTWPEGTVPVAHSPDGACVLLTKTGEPATFQLLDTQNESVVATFKLDSVEKVLSAALSDRGQRVAILGANRWKPAKDSMSTVYVWDKSERRVIWQTVSGPKVNGNIYGTGVVHPGFAWQFLDDLCISADGSRIAVAGITRDRPELIKWFCEGEKDGAGYMIVEGAQTGCEVFDVGQTTSQPLRILPRSGFRRRVLSANGRYVFTWRHCIDLVEGTEFEMTAGSLNPIDATTEPEWKFDSLRPTRDPSTIAVYSGDEFKKQWYLVNLDEMSVTAMDKDRQVYYADDDQASFSSVTGYIEYEISDREKSINPGARLPSDMNDLCTDELMGAFTVFTQHGFIRYPLVAKPELETLAALLEETTRISPDGRYLVDNETVDGTEVYVVRSTATLQKLLTLPYELDETVAFSRDGRSLAATENGVVSIFNIEHAKLERRIEKLDLAFYDTSGGGLSFSDDGSYLGVLVKPADDSKDDEYAYRIYDRGSGQLVSEIRVEAELNVGWVDGSSHAEPLFGISGPNAITCIDNELRKFELFTGRLVGQLSLERAACTALSKKGDLIAVASEIDLRLIDLSTMQVVRTWKLQHGAARTLAWGSHDARLFLDYEHRTDVLDVATGEVTLSIPKPSEGFTDTIPSDGDAAIINGRYAPGLPVNEWLALLGRQRRAETRSANPADSADVSR